MKRTGAGRHARGSACCTLVTDGNRPSLDHRMTSLPRYQDTKDQRPMKTSPSPRANYTTTPQVDPTIDFFPFPSPLSFFYFLSLSLSPFPERSHSRIPTPTRLVSRPLTAVVFTIIKRVCLRARFLSPRRALRQQVEGSKDIEKRLRGVGDILFITCCQHIRRIRLFERMRSRIIYVYYNCASNPVFIFRLVTTARV